MSRVLQDFPKHFQWVPMTIGDSTRHTRDMGDGSWSCDPISGEGVLFSADGLRAGKVSYEILVGYRGGLSEISGEICGEAISKNPSLSDVTLKLKNKQRVKTQLDWYYRGVCRS
jgi:hypothetical protein